MQKLLPTRSLSKVIRTLHENGKRIVLAGGCFDILHPGHISFLTKAKAHGDILMLLLESDERIRHDKGEKRPIHTQKERAHMLEALSMVDHIILLPRIMSGPEYDRLIIQIKPAIMATTAGDPYLHERKRQSTLVGGRVISVIRKKKYHSTTRLVDLLASEL